VKESFLSQAAEPTKQIRHIIELSLLFTSKISLEKKKLKIKNPKRNYFLEIFSCESSNKKKIKNSPYFYTLFK
jgi:hypothetical protein